MNEDYELKIGKKVKGLFFSGNWLHSEHKGKIIEVTEEEIYIYGIVYPKGSIWIDINCDKYLVKRESIFIIKNKKPYLFVCFCNDERFGFKTWEKENE